LAYVAVGVEEYKSMGGGRGKEESMLMAVDGVLDGVSFLRNRENSENRHSPVGENIGDVCKEDGLKRENRETREVCTQYS
jgi:hypothetical protein